MLCASGLATARTACHDRVGRASAADLKAGNSSADFCGVLSELLIIEGAYKAGLEPQGYVPFIVRPSNRPDFTLNGKTYDVKSVPLGKEYACINAAKHDQCPPDYYLIVMFDSRSTATVSLVPSRDVDRLWERRTGHSDYYSIHRNQLPLLSSWNELEGGSK